MTAHTTRQGVEIECDALTTYDGRIVPCEQRFVLPGGDVVGARQAARQVEAWDTNHAGLLGVDLCPTHNG